MWGEYIGVGVWRVPVLPLGATKYKFNAATLPYEAHGLIGLVNKVLPMRSI